MVTKRPKIVEIIPDLWETKKKPKRSKKLTKEEKEEEEGSPLIGIFCLKTRQNMKIIEEKEYCFILDFDPYDSFDARKLTVIDNPEDDNEVTIIQEKGQVACRDFPHPRHLCLKYPFDSTHHATHCRQCYCYVCDLAAPCSHWKPSCEPHCDAIENDSWKRLRELHRTERQ